MIDPTRRAVIDAAERFARQQVAAAPAGHDWWHIDRVRRMALRIAHDEGADEFIVELAALLHEIGDTKANHDESEGPDLVRAWLRRLSVAPSVMDSIGEVIAAVPYRGAGVPDAPVSREGQCVRDADRLDAIGAIGIARTFTYGGSIGRVSHDPQIPPRLHTTAEEYRASRSTTVNHFTEKLLLLRGRMDTKLGRTLADHRHRVMVAFLDEFQREWAGRE